MFGDKETSGDELNEWAHFFLGRSWAGVFPQDKVPQIEKGKCYIVNLDLDGMSGSHWTGIYGVNNNTPLIYDSFGRKSKNILPVFLKPYKNYIDVDYDKEQYIRQEDCGQRSLAWLIVCKYYGSAVACRV